MLAQASIHPGLRPLSSLAVLAVCGLLLGGSAAARADNGADASLAEAGVRSSIATAGSLKVYPLGITKHELDHATEVTGWQVRERWYFGRARGEDSGLALIWQPKASQQMSLSSDGLRFTHRF